MTPELMEMISEAAVGRGNLVDWGEPDEDGFYTPKVTITDATLEAPAGLNVERLGFSDLLAIGRALLAHYPPDTIVCSHSVKADVGARTVAGIADLIASCASTPPPTPP